MAGHDDVLACNKSRLRSEDISVNIMPVTDRNSGAKFHMNILVARCVRLIPSLAPYWYAIPLRLIVGYGFMEHGFAKLARGPESFIDILGALGVPDPRLAAWATILVEIFGGLAVLVGLFIPLASVPMMAVLVVAIFTVHLPNGFSSIKLLSVTATGAHFGQPGYETDLLYLAALMALVLGGAGPLALDRTLLRWWTGDKVPSGN
jgi:putative oxidoreductase